MALPGLSGCRERTAAAYIVWDFQTLEDDDTYFERNGISHAQRVLEAIKINEYPDLTEVTLPLRATGYGWKDATTGAVTPQTTDQRGVPGHFDLMYKGKGVSQNGMTGNTFFRMAI